MTEAAAIATSAPRERPILFSGPMVRAILTGAKSQTRRIIRDLRVRLPYEVKSDLPTMIRPERRGKPGIHPAEMNQHGAVAVRLDDGELLGVKPGEFDFVCPYAVGTTRLVDHQWRIEPHGEQRLWVRETWCPDALRGERPKPGTGVVYRASYDDKGEPIAGWRPSIHMPRWASRLTLEITEVRVQRLQETTEQDARAEGVQFDGKWWLGAPHPVKDTPKCYPTAREAFASRWDAINGERGDWKSNPFVWAISFRALAQGAARGR